MATTHEYMTFNNIDTIFEEYKCSLILITVDSIKRSFCKCGHVDNHHVYVCPKCGNRDIIATSLYNSYSYPGGELHDVYSIEYDSTKTIATFKGKRYVITKDNIKKEFDIDKKRDDVIIEINNNKLNVVNTSYFRTFGKADLRQAINNIEKMESYTLSSFKDDLETFKKEYKAFDNDFYKYNYVDDYAKIYPYAKALINDLKAYISYVSLKDRLPDLFTPENFKSVFIAQMLNKNALIDIPKNTTMKDLIKLIKLEDFEEYLNNDWFYPEKLYPLKIDVYNSLDDSQKEIVKYAVGHYKISYMEAEALSESIKDNEDLYTGRFQKLFLDFIKSNLVVFKSNTIKEFKKRIQFLNKHGIPIDEVSLKNYCLYKNIESLKNEKYPEGNVNLITDMFYDNPLKAMQYLKSKKAFTKKEINELIEKIK